MFHRTELIGRVGRDPELRFTSSGQAVANFSVCVSEKFKGKDGAVQERSIWYQVQVWSKLAEICGEYCTKGMLVFIDGRMNERVWQDKSGAERRTWELIANKVDFLSKASERSSGSEQHESGAGGGGEEEPPWADDDIPF